MQEHYQERYVAFVDILGFRNLIAELDQDPTLLDKFRKLLSDVHRPPESLRDFFKDSDLKSSSISDAVALSAPITPQGLNHIFAAVEHLTIKLMLLGYFARGAIAKGRLFHDDNVVLGSGLVRAYSFESSVAVYPRVMLPIEIVKDVKRFQSENSMRPEYANCVRRSEDGPHFLHVLRYYERIKQFEGDERAKQLTTLVQIRDLIEQRLDEAVDSPAHYKKVRWFANYWNDVFYGVDGLKRIEAPGLEFTLTLE